MQPGSRPFKENSALHRCCGRLVSRLVWTSVQGIKDLKKQPNVAFNGSTSGLQVNVAVPDLGGLGKKVRAVCWQCKVFFCGIALL